MKEHCFLALMIGFFGTLSTALPALSDAPGDKKANAEEYQNLMITTGKQTDPVLESRIHAFRKNFAFKEAAYTEDRDRTIEAIKDNGSFTKSEKGAKIAKAQDQYRKRSWKLVARLREPVNRRLLELANLGLSEKQRVEAGAGKELYVEKEVIKGGKKTVIRVRNPEHSGAASDTDSQAGTKGIDRMAKIAEAHGLKVYRDGNTLDIPEIEHTINRHPHEYDDQIGSSSQQERLYADAHNKERFLYFGINENDPSLAGVREAVEKRDHIKKAIDGINMGKQSPTRLLRKKNRDTFQKFGKSTRKMATNISDPEIRAIMKKNNLPGTPETYKKSLANLHGRNWNEHGITKKNVAAWYKTSRDIQDLSMQKADKNAARNIASNKADLGRIANQLKDKNLTEYGKRRLIEKYRNKKSSLIDANERLKQTQQVLDEKIKKDNAKPRSFTAPGIFSDLSSRSTTRKKINTIASKNFRRIGKGMGFYGKLKKAFYVADLLKKGDVNEMANYAYQEAKDEALDRLKARLVPGYGNMKLAFDVGWGTGRLIGANVRLGPGGPTVDEVAEQQMFLVYDAVSGNRKTKWDQQRNAAYQNYFYEQLAETPGALPPGMSPSKAFALAKEKAMAEGNFFAAMDKVFEDGMTRVEERHKAKSEYLDTKNTELVDDAKRETLVREALDLGFSSYDLSGKSSGELQAMIEARKAQLARLEAEEKAWEKARNLDTQIAYIEYAGQFIDGAHFDLAQKLATERMKEELDKVIAEAEKRKAAKEKAAQAYNFDEKDDTGSVDAFRKKMARMRVKAGESPAYNKSASAGSVFDQGLADQKKYEDDLAYIEKTKRETAEIWKKINEKRARRAKKKAKRNQFWRDFSTAMGQAVQDYNEQQQHISTASQQPSSSYDFDDQETAGQEKSQSTFEAQRACGCYNAGFDEWESTKRIYTSANVSKAYVPSSLTQCRSKGYRNSNGDEKNYSSFWEYGWKYSKSAYKYGSRDTKSGWAVGNSGKRSKETCNTVISRVGE